MSGDRKTYEVACYRRKVVTVHNFTFVPPSQDDFTAFYDGDEPNDNGVMSMGVGYGASREAAIADLIENHPENDAPAVAIETA